MIQAPLLHHGQRSSLREHIEITEKRAHQSKGWVDSHIEGCEQGNCHQPEKSGVEAVPAQPTHQLLGDTDSEKRCKHSGPPGGPRPQAESQQQAGNQSTAIIKRRLLLHDLAKEKFKKDSRNHADSDQEDGVKPVHVN